MGAVAGVLAGLLGIGGGIIIVPVLVLVLEHQQVSPEVLMHVAIGTSLATIVFTSISSIRSHQKHNAVLWPVFLLITPGIVIGGLLGSFTAKFVSGEYLRIAFGFFLLLVAVQMIAGATPKPHRELPKRVGMTIAGGTIGLLSSLMGVGGGTMSVPFMVWCNISIQNAVATSAAIGLPIALSGVTGFIITGWNAAERPLLSVGFVNVPAFLSIVVASILFAPVGARIAHRLPARKLKTVFGIVLVVFSIKILY